MAHKRTPGEGSIIRRKDGRWQASLQLDGVRKTVYGKTRSEVVQKLEELRRQAVAGGALPNPGRRTLNDLLDVYLATKQADLKRSTAEHYELLVNTYIRPALGNVLLAKLTPHRIQVLLGKLRDRPRVAQLVYHILKQACDLAVRWHWLAENPCKPVVRPQYRPKRKTVWTPDELQTFLKGARGHWLFPLWYFLLASGCRLGEALALTWQDVNLEQGTVQINRTVQRLKGQTITDEPKTKSAVRTVSLPQDVVQALRQQLSCQVLSGAVCKLVFPSPSGEYLHRSVVAHALRRECERLGLPPMTPHGLRHLHASLLLEAGLPVPQVAQRLGHATPQVTMSVYAHALNRSDREAAEVLQRAMGAHPIPFIRRERP
jgi:integrase